MGIAVAILATITGLIGLGLASAGIYYTATDWGSSEGSKKARVYSLLIAGLIIMALAIGGMVYYMFKPSTIAKNEATALLSAVGKK